MLQQVINMYRVLVISFQHEHKMNSLEILLICYIIPIHVYAFRVLYNLKIV